MFGTACALGALVLTKQTDPVIAGIAIASASVGALSPDLDHPQATLSRKNIIFGASSAVMSNLSSHRRFWHTIPACLIFTAAYFVLIGVIGNAFGGALDTYFDVPKLMPYYIWAAVYFFIGAFSHLVADSFNPQGAPLLWPIQPNLNKKVHVPVICVETGSPGEMIYMAIFSLMAVVLGCVYLSYILGIDLIKLVFIW